MPKSNRGELLIMWNSAGVQEALQRVRSTLQEETGYPTVGLAKSDVPSEFHSLLEVAEQFGVGDDPLREILVDMMPTPFIASVERLLKDKEASLETWMEEGEWTVEKNAFVAIMQSFLERSHPPCVDVPQGAVDAIGAALDRFLQKP